MFMGAKVFWGRGGKTEGVREGEKKLHRGRGMKKKKRTHQVGKGTLVREMEIPHWKKKGRRKKSEKERISRRT